MSCNCSSHTSTIKVNNTSVRNIICWEITKIDWKLILDSLKTFLKLAAHEPNSFQLNATVKWKFHRPTKILLVSFHLHPYARKNLVHKLLLKNLQTDIDWLNSTVNQAADIVVRIRKSMVCNINFCTVLFKTQFAILMQAIWILNWGNMESWKIKWNLWKRKRYWLYPRVTFSKSLPKCYRNHPLHWCLSLLVTN